MNTEYYITPVPFLPSQCPVFVSRKYGQPSYIASATDRKPSRENFRASELLDSYQLFVPIVAIL
jgi:hypothetical protein